MLYILQSIMRGSQEQLLKQESGGWNLGNTMEKCCLLACFSMASHARLPVK